MLKTIELVMQNMSLMFRSTKKEKEKRKVTETDTEK